jgi:hypothetical protein
MTHIYIDNIFRAKQARNGGIVRRSLRWINRQGLLPALKREVRRRGFHMILCGGQAVILCNSGALAVIV